MEDIICLLLSDFPWPTTMTTVGCINSCQMSSMFPCNTRFTRFLLHHVAARVTAGFVCLKVLRECFGRLAYLSSFNFIEAFKSIL